MRQAARIAAQARARKQALEGGQERTLFTAFRAGRRPAERDKGLAGFFTRRFFAGGAAWPASSTFSCRSKRRRGKKTTVYADSCTAAHRKGPWCVGTDD